MQRYSVEYCHFKFSHEAVIIMGVFVSDGRDINEDFTSEPASTILPMKTPVFFDLMSMVTYRVVRLDVRARVLTRQVLEKLLTTLFPIDYSFQRLRVSAMKLKNINIEMGREVSKAK